MAFTALLGSVILCLCILYSYATAIRSPTKSLERRFGQYQIGFPDKPNITWRYAGYRTVEGEFHGGTAKMSLWSIPGVQHNSYSQVHIAAVKRNGDDNNNVIAAGFHVHPGLYHNDDLRFFTYWTRDDGESTGCFNIECEGFVVEDTATIKPGQAMAPPLSSYDGSDHYVTLSIKKDGPNGDWILSRTDGGVSVTLGRWPKPLFDSLNENAAIIIYSGMVAYEIDTDSTPPMGSGHFATEGEQKAAYFKQIAVFDQNGDSDDSSARSMDIFADERDCYTVSDSLETTQDDGTMFYYGGPSCNKK